MTMSDPEFASRQAGERFRRLNAWRRTQERERARERQAKIKHVRQLLNRDGFFAVLRQFAEGADTLKREDQLRILKMVEDAVQAALPPKPPPEYRASCLPDTRTRFEKLLALAADPSATSSEREAARQAAERLRKQSD